MKRKVTQREMSNGYNTIITIGYCHAAHLLKFETPIAYSAGVYGWNCDYYNVEGVLICTGYRTIKSKNSKAEYELIDKYEKQAKTINENYTENWATRKEKTRTILNDFIKECTNN